MWAALAVSALESINGGDAGPAGSGPARQDAGSMFNNGGLTINKPNYVMWGVVALGLLVAYKVVAKKK